MGAALDPAVALARLVVRRAVADLVPGEDGRETEPGPLLLVALSGGPDSLALAAATSFVAPRGRLRWGAVVVDHGLQPGSDRVAAGAADQARILGADPVRVVPVAVDPTRRLGPEAAAREARQAALATAAAAESAAAVLLGHTRDDQAEGVLLGLARGSGPRSLAGMRPRSGLLRRPFLALSRAETTRVCEVLELRSWHDPHNTDVAHTRARVRTVLLPALERELGPGVAAALARTADLLRADADLLDALAADLYASVRLPAGPPEDERAVRLDVSRLAGAAPALRRRVLRRAALEAGAPGGDLAAGHVDALDALLTGWHGQRGVDLPGRVRATRAAGVLHVVRRTS